MSDEARGAASNLLEEWYAHRTAGLPRASYLFVDILDAMTKANYMRMATMLRRLEWWGGSCPECCVERFTGRDHSDNLVPIEPPPHEPDCELSALLRELP